MNIKRTMSKVLAVAFMASLLSPVSDVMAKGAGTFKDPLKPASRDPWKGKKFISKPLVILMDYKDYSHKDIDKKETSRINNFKGEDGTAEFYQNFLFGENYKDPTTGVDYVTPRKFFQSESGGSYVYDGKVVGWYTAEHDAKYYGTDRNKDGSSQDEAADLVREAIKKAAEDPNVDLSKFDVEDKWDYNKNGNFYEPDGILDSVIVIHPGIGKELGGGFLKEDAIWPFRSWLSVDEKDSTDKKKSYFKFKDDKAREWQAEDFAIFEQDLPVDLMCHEYGHVLGLPDLYAGDQKSTPPAENWSLMGGSYTGPIQGSKANGYGAYCRELLQKDFESRNIDMNWSRTKNLDFDTLKQKGENVVLDQSCLTGNNYTTIKIDLPKKETINNTMADGNYSYFSAKGDNLRNSMSTKEPINLTGLKDGRLEFIAWYDIDPGYDFASVQVKEHGTNEWIPLKGNITTTEVDPELAKIESAEQLKLRNPGHGITYDSGKNWAFANFDLKDYIGKQVDLKFQWNTDTNTPAEGIYIDYIKVYGDDKEIFFDDAESQKDCKFNLNGFTLSDGKELSDHYYAIEWRNSKNGDVDQGLDYTTSGINYDPGMIVWYVNKKMVDGRGRPDQNSMNHAGEVYAGVVDADQEPIIWEQGTAGGLDRLGTQLKDAAFGLREGDPVNKLWDNGAITKDPHTFMEPIFYDNNDYTNPASKDGGSLVQVGLKLDKLGLKVFVTEESKDRSSAKVHITTDKTQTSEVQDASVIESIKVLGDSIVLKTKDEYADNAYISYVSEDGTKKGECKLKLMNGSYEGKADFAKGSKDTWKINFIVLHDKEGNAKSFYNKDIHKVFGADLTLGNFNLKDTVSVQYYNKAEDFKKGKEVDVVSKVINMTDKKQDAILVVGIYDLDNSLIKLEKSEKIVVNENSNKELKCKIKLPNKNVKVRAFIWNNWETSKPLGEFMEYDVK